MAICAEVCRLSAMCTPEQTIVRDNVSYFHNCTFAVNSDYSGPDAFISHVNLFKVRGVRFTACDFRLEDNPFNHQWLIGIHGYDVGFIVDGSYNMLSNGTVGVNKKSTFDNFFKAVVSTNDGFVGGRTFTDATSIPNATLPCGTGRFPNLAHCVNQRCLSARKPRHGANILPVRSRVAPTGENWKNKNMAIRRPHEQSFSEP